MNGTLTIKSRAKDLVFKGLNKLSPLTHHLASPWASILMYHSIGYNHVFFTVRPEEFQWQMNFLKENRYHIVCLHEIERYLRNSTPIPHKTVAITFDDAYEDFYHYAFPILKSHKFKSTVFIPTEYVGKTMNNSNHVPLSLLTWEQIREMHQSGWVQFGPHGVHHIHLTELDYDGVRYEITASRDAIRQNVGEDACDIFCYPRGKYNSEVIRILDEHGFSAAVTVDRGVVHHKADLFALRRNSIDSATTRTQFIGKLNYSIELFRQMSKK